MCSSRTLPFSSSWTGASLWVHQPIEVGRAGAERLSIKGMWFLTSSLLCWGWGGMLTWGKADTMWWGSPDKPMRKDPWGEELVPPAAGQLQPPSLLTSLAFGSPLTPGGEDTSYLCCTLPKFHICEQNTFCHCFSHYTEECLYIMQPSSWEQDSWKEMSRSPTLTPGIDGSGAQTMLSETSFSLFLGPALSLLILVSNKLCPPGGDTAGVVTQKFLFIPV